MSASTITAGPPTRSDPSADTAHDRSNRVLTARELRDIRQSFENAREAIGPDHDIIVHCHWKYNRAS